MDAPKNEQVILTREEIRTLIDETVHETLEKLGIEPEEVKDMQRDFIFLRQLRMTHEQVKSRALIVLVGTIVTVTIGAIGLGIKSIIVSGGKTP